MKGTRLAAPHLRAYTVRGMMRTTLTVLAVLGVAITALAIRAAIPGRASESPPPLVRVIPADGEGITAPRALAAGGGRLYAFDEEGFVRIYDYEGELLRSVLLVETRREFSNGAILEPGGTVLIADSHGSCLLRTDADGNKIETLGGGYGCEPGQFVYPQHLAILGDRIYVSEFGFRPNCRVQVFSRAGEFLFSFGSWGTDGPAFKRPAGIVVGPDGLIHVADASHRILAWTPDGQYRGSFGTEGEEPGMLRYPWGLAADDRYLYCVEYGNHRVSRFRPDGTFAGTWGGADAMRFPRDLAIADGWLFIADTGRNRILRLPLADIPWRSDP